MTNGTPLWLQDSAWSRGVHEFLERWLDTSLTFRCGTDEESQQRYGDALARAGFEVSGAAVSYVADLSFDQLVGGLYSAIPVDRLPTLERRPAFAEQVRAAVVSRERFSEPVHVAILIGRARTERDWLSVVPLAAAENGCTSAWCPLEFGKLGIMTWPQNADPDATRDPGRPARLLRAEHDALLPILGRTEKRASTTRRRAQAGRFAMC